MALRNLIAIDYSRHVTDKRHIYAELIFNIIVIIFSNLTGSKIYPSSIYNTAYKIGHDCVEYHGMTSICGTKYSGHISNISMNYSLQKQCPYKVFACPDLTWL